MPFNYSSDGVLYTMRDLVMSPRPPERILAHLYFQFETQNRLSALFHENDSPSLLWFLQTFLAPETSTLICYRVSECEIATGGSYMVDGKWYTPIGMTWINKTWPIGINFRKSECGMAFVRGVPVDDTVDCARMTVQWAFENLAIDVLIGTTPEPNRAAVIFGQKVGFQQTGPLEGYTAWHGKLCSVILSSMTKDRWEKLKSIWKDE